MSIQENFQEVEFEISNQLLLRLQCKETITRKNSREV